MVAVEELEPVVTVPHGRANGYHHPRGLQSVLGHGAELTLDRSAAQQDGNQDGSPVVVGNDESTSPKQPNTQAAADVKAGLNGAAKRTGQPAAGRKTKAARKAKVVGTSVKYVAQAELDAELATLQQLSNAALAGDTEALDKLRAALGRCRHTWRRVGDLQLLVEHKLVELVAKRDPLRLESFRKRWSELRHELLDGDQASLATKMAASRVVTCWLFTQLLELRILESPAELRNIKSLEQAERRFGVAMRTFERARLSDLQLERLAQQTTGLGA
jgi:hypothetical protein